jgi:hypothetical protein
MILASAFAIFWAIKTKKAFPSVISVGMILGIAFVIFSIESFQAFGFYIYNCFVILAFVYGFVKKDLTSVSRIVIILMATSTFTYWLWSFNHWHGNVVIFPIFTLFVALSGFFGKAKLKDELGFLVILAVDAVAILIENWMKAN